MARFVAPSGAELIDADVFEDERGFSEEVSLPVAVQRALTVTSDRGVIRGMHFQDWRAAPLWKVVSVVVGSIEDFVVDLRAYNPDKIEKYTLRDNRPQYLAIPPWCAHGYAVTSDLAVVQYLFDAPRCESAERVIHYRTLPIAWPAFPLPILSEKDRQAPPMVRVLAELGRTTPG